MCELSLSTVEKLESGRLKLSEDVAFRISRETGVSLEWLLAGDIAIHPPKNQYIEFESKPFTKAVFEQRRSQIEAGNFEPPEPISFDSDRSAAISATLESATRAGKRDLALYKLNRFLRDFQAEFGISQEEYDRKMAIKAHLLELEAMLSNQDIPDDEGSRQAAEHRLVVPEFIGAYEKGLSKDRIRWEKLKETKSLQSFERSGLFLVLHWILGYIRLNRMNNLHPKISQMIRRIGDQNGSSSKKKAQR